MILWSIQPLHILKLIQETGTYICDPNQIPVPDFSEPYDWLAKKMAERIGPPPPGARFPVWAWYMQDSKRKKPDLRRERWGCWTEGEFVCMELEIPDEQVLLSDFDTWHLVLNNSLISDSEEEDLKQDAFYDSLPDSLKQEYKDKNWERIFDITPLHNERTTRGEWIQATFWELKKDYVRHIYHFRAVNRVP